MQKDVWTRFRASSAAAVWKLWRKIPYTTMATISLMQRTIRLASYIKKAGGGGLKEIVSTCKVLVFCQSFSKFSIEHIGKRLRDSFKTVATQAFHADRHWPMWSNRRIFKVIICEKWFYGDRCSKQFTKWNERKWECNTARKVSQL